VLPDHLHRLVSHPLDEAKAAAPGAVPPTLISGPA